MKKILIEDYSPGSGIIYKKGVIGEVMKVDWPNKNPTLLIFGNDVRDVFPDNVLDDAPDDMPLSCPDDPYDSMRRDMTESNVVTLLKMERMYKIWCHLDEVRDWVSTPDLFDAIGVPKTYLHLVTSRNHGGTSLESLELIEQDPNTMRPAFWRLTKKGVEEGYDTLRSLHSDAWKVMGQSEG